MLNTIKQFKKLLDINGKESISGSETINFSDKIKKEPILNIDEFIKNHKSEIIKWIEKNSSDGSIGLENLNDNTSWNNLIAIAQKLGVSISEEQVKSNSYPVAGLLNKLNNFSISKTSSLDETKAEVEDLKKFVNNSGEKTKSTETSVKEEKVEIKENSDFYSSSNTTDTYKETITKNVINNKSSKEKSADSSKKVEVKKEEKEIKNISDSIKNFDSSKYSDKKYSKEVLELQKELNSLGFKLKEDGLFGKNTKRDLEKAKNGEKSENKSTKEASNDKNLNEKVSVDKNLLEKAQNGELSDIIKNFDSSKYDSKKFYTEVKDLQTELNKYGANLKKIDGIFGKETRKAYNNVISLIEKKQVIDSQFTANSDFGTDKKTDAPLVAEDKTFEETQKQIKKTGDTMDELSSRLEATKELNDKLSDYYFRNNSGYSIEAGVRKLFGKDEWSKIVTEKEKYENIMKSPEKRARLEKAIGEVLYLQLPDEKRNEDTFEYDRRVNKAKNDLTDKFLKASPWIFGIYLGDIPISIGQKILPSVHVDEAKVFQEWIKSGMNQEYSDYKKSNKPEELKPIKELITLKDFLSRTNLSSSEQAKILSGDLSGLDKKTEKLLFTYMKEILIPSMKALKEGSFTIFSYFGRKHSSARNIIKNMEAMVNSGSISGYEKELKEFLDVIREEGDVSNNIISDVSSSNDYMGRISGNNREIQRQFRGLAELGQEKYNTYNRVFALKDISDLKKLGVSDSDKKSLENLLNILNAKNIDGNALDSWEKSNPSALKFIKALGNPEAMKDYQISAIPRNQNLRQLKKSEIEKDTNFNDTHGIRLEGNDNQEDYRLATTTSVDAKSGLSTLGFAYKSFVEKAGLVGFSYSEFEEAFKQKQKIDINNFDGQVINTNRNSDGRIGKLTSFKELAEKRKDTHVFKMKIEKNYTYYEDGKEVKVNASYDLFMRPDCSNPLIVPNTINIKKDGKEVPEGEIKSINSVKGKLPIVIPWGIFTSKTPNPGLETQTGDKVLSVNSSADATKAKFVGSEGSNIMTFAKK